jgi:hypothetical protein
MFTSFLRFYVISLWVEMKIVLKCIHVYYIGYATAVYILKRKRNAYFTFWHYLYVKWRCELDIISNCFIEYWQEVHGWKITQPWKEEVWMKHEILAKILSCMYMRYNLIFCWSLFFHIKCLCAKVSHFICADIDLIQCLA